MMGAVTEQETEALIVKSEIHLEPRPGDNVIDAEELRQFDLFRRMKKSVSIEKFPGSIILRKYRKGEVVFQQGQSGGTAFYIPTAEDLVRLKALEEGKEPPANPVVDPNRDRQVLSALILPSSKKPRPRGFFERWFGSSDNSRTPSTKFAAIPNDGPSDIDFQTREAPLFEGNLFGEMSCISFMPRSATVVARQDCWLLEFNRNVFDQIRGDKNHQDLLEEEYRRRTLDTHLRQFELFKGLTEPQIQLLKDNVTLQVVPPGNVICEEGEKWSDSKPLDVFIVRNGVVQVIVNAHLSVRMEDIRDWTEICRLLDDSQPDLKGEATPKTTTPVKAVVTTGRPEEGAGAKPASPLERMRQAAVQAEKAGTAAAVVTNRAQAETNPAAPAKPSPLEQMRAKQAAAAKSGASPAESPSTEGGGETSSADLSAVPVKKLSPLEQMRAKQAAAVAAKNEAVSAEPAATGSSEASAEQSAAAPVKKLSPLEQMRAKQAAAAAAKSEVVSAEPAATGSGEASAEEPAAAPVKKLSPLEQMRAKQAAAAAAKSEVVTVESPSTGSEDAPAVEPTAAPVKKLSPLEQMRAKQAAAAAAKSEAVSTESPATGSGDTFADEHSAVPIKKLSPLEQMRAKQAAAKAGGTVSTSVEPSPAAATGKTEPEETARVGKLSPLEMMRAKQGQKGPPSTAGQETVLPVANQSSTVIPQTPSPLIVKEAPLLRKPNANLSGPPVFVVKSWLNDQVAQAIHQIAAGELKEDSLISAQTLIANALNELAQNREFLSDKRIIAEIYSKPAILRKTASFPKGFKGISKEWSEMELRTAGRAALSEIFPNLIRRPAESSGPPRVLAYLSRGECIGEIAVVRGTQRNATCIAYNHPSSENPRDFGNVELVRIRGSAFRQLMSESPELERQVKNLADKRLKEVESIDVRSTEPDLIASAEFQQMGLFQGSRLLVIDLDSCTRCGDCVQACVETHDDGASRLFLDGPRYDRFLVPSACRNCLNPVCMIGCPVGSIGRGENGQIEIYDWCIGCSACADQCPYDSIQMHDLGLIPEESSGWLYANRRSLQDDWYRSSRLGGGWMQGESPFRWQGEYLRQWVSADTTLSKEQPLQLCFRHEFRLPKKSKSQRYRISINDARRKGAVEKTRVKTSKVIGVWLNGEELKLLGNSIELKTEQFSRTNNVLAIEVALDSPPEYGQFVLSACLDAISEVGTQALEVLGTEVHSEMDLVTRRAAVCDLCSHLPSQQPACVSSCPHDAAIRVNPMINFPM